MDRRVLLLVLLLAEDERLAAKSVLDGLNQVTPGLRVAVVDGQAQLRTLTPLTPATYLAGAPHLSGQVAAPGLHSRLGHHLYGLQIQLEADDRTPQGYVVACIWGDAARQTTADLGDYAAFAALDCPVELRHYFLGDTAGGLRAKPPPTGSGISVEAWMGVDPASIAKRVEALAEGKFPPLGGAVPVDLGRGPKARGTGVAPDDRTGGDGESAAEAKAAFATAKAVAALSDDPEWQADMLTEIGVAQAVAGLTADAKATFSRAKAVTTLSDDWGWRSDMLTEIGRGEGAAGLATEAKASFAAAKAAGAAAADDGQRDPVYLLTDIGVAEATAGLTADAKATFTEAKAIGMDPVYMLTMIGVAEVAAGLTADAKATFAAAKAAAAALIDDLDWGGEYERRAVILTEIARAEISAGHTTEAKATAAHLDDPSDRALMLQEIARAEVDTGHPSDAMVTFAAAVAAAAPIDDPDWWRRVQILTELARVEVATGHASEARATISAAKAAAAALRDDPETQSYVLTMIALTEAGAGHPTESKATFVAAKAAAQGNGWGDMSERLTAIASAEATAGLTSDAKATFAAAKAAAHDEWERLSDIAYAEAGAGHTTESKATFAAAKAATENKYDLAAIDYAEEAAAIFPAATAKAVEPPSGEDARPVHENPNDECGEGEGSPAQMFQGRDAYGATHAGGEARGDAEPEDGAPTSSKAPGDPEGVATPNAGAKAKKATERAEYAHSKETAELVGSSLTGTPQPPMAEGTYRLTLRFGQNWSSGVHTGLDFAGPTGTPIVASSSGTVVSAEYAGAYGNQVIIDHGEGYQTAYGHLSAIAVSVGDKVSTGDQIGKRGSTGNSTGPNLHFEVTKDATFIDPESWLGW